MSARYYKTVWWWFHGRQRRVVSCGTASVSSFASVFVHENSGFMLSSGTWKNFSFGQLCGFFARRQKKRGEKSECLSTPSPCVTSLCSVQVVLLRTFCLLRNRRNRLMCLFFLNHVNIETYVAVLSQVSPSSRQVEANRIRRHHPVNQKSKSWSHESAL